MRGNCITAAAAVAAILALGAAAPAGAVVGTGLKGPTTTVNPYVLPTAHGVQTTSLLTVTDLPAQNGYKMVGIPDGLGARTRAGKLEVFMNHELSAGSGIVRAHGQTGAFVSNLQVNKGSLAVESGQDLIGAGDISYWNYPAGIYQATPSPAGGPFAAQGAAFNRFCSSTLTDPGQLLNETSGNGFAGQIYFGNEEGGDESRSFGILADDGTTKQLPRLGLFSWENTIPAPNTSDTTLVQGQEDTGAGQVWAYIGTKTNSGDAFQRAGLTNGTNHVADLLNEAVSTDAQFRAAFGKNNPQRFDLSAVDWNQPGSAQNTQGAAQGITLNRVEDGHWDPDHPNDFYFVTTQGGSTTPAPGGSIPRDGGGLWRMRYDNIENPSLGGTLTLLLDGSESPFLSKPDNITIDTHGNILIQEDPGSNAALARIVAYEIGSGRRGVVATFDPALFAPVTPGGSDAPFTIDEESSGIIDLKGILGDGKFLFDAQVHEDVSPDPFGLVQHGQLLLLDVDDFEAVYSGQPTVADNPVGFWRMGEESGITMFDSSGNDNDGTYLGGVVLGAPGVFANNTAATFDGFNDTARVPDSSSLDVGSSFTVEGWIKRSSTTKTHELFNKGANGLQLVVMGGTGQVFLRKAGVTTIARSNTGVAAGGYHHVVATMDGPGTARIYIDGVQSTVTVGAVQAIQDTAFALTFGSANSTPAQYDEFALYDQALTPAQVTAHYLAVTSPPI